MFVQIFYFFILQPTVIKRSYQYTRLTSVQIFSLVILLNFDAKDYYLFPYVYGNVFRNTPAMNLQLIVGNRNRRDAKNELVRKRPKPSILQNKRIKNKYLKFLGKSSFHSMYRSIFTFQSLERRRQMKKTTSFTVTTDHS
jgi:hypothetical protein